MNLTGIKSKSVYLIETALLYVLSCAVTYYTLLFSSRSGLFELSHRTSAVCRFNPSLMLPYLIALLFGMVITPLVWEKMVRRIDLVEMGFCIRRPFLRDAVYGAALFLLFVAYTRMVLSKQSGLLSLSASVIISLCVRWLFVAFAEEVLFRVVIQRRLSMLCGRYWGLLLASAVFAFVGHPRASVIDNLILRLPFGLILGFLYLRSRSLLIPVTLHWGFNVLFAI